MKPNITPRIPADRELDAGTGLVLVVLGVVILLLGLAADGRLTMLPVLLGGGFAAAGTVILALNWRGRRRKRAQR